MAYEDQELPAPPKKGIITFGRPSPPQQGQDLSPIISDVTSVSRRLRLIEESTTNLRRFFQTVEQQMLDKNRHFTTEVKTINSDILEIRKDMNELRDKMLLIIKELQSVARKEEVRVLEKYINLWNPIKFVTHNEVEDIIDEILIRRFNRKA